MTCNLMGYSLKLSCHKKAIIFKPNFCIYFKSCRNLWEPMVPTTEAMIWFLYTAPHALWLPCSYVVSSVPFLSWDV